MKFKVGDKVKFLNEHGGGVISKIIDHEIVHVAIEDGFDIPTLTKDLVKIEDEASAAERQFNKEINVDISKSIPANERSYSAEIKSVGGYDGDKIENGIFLTYTPNDQNICVQGPLKMHLVNNTNLEIMYQIYLKEDKEFEFLSQGELNAFSSCSLGSSDREDIAGWLGGMIQILAKVNKTTSVPAPASVIFNMKGARLYKEASYRKTNLLPDKLIPILLRSEKQFSISAPISEKEDSDVQNEKARRIGNEFIKRFITSEGVAEVDLHIHEITEDHKHMQPSEILKIQIGYFERALESAISANIKKLIIIHGVGQGILKAEINKILKQYNFIDFFDAPMKKFGVGATEILIRQQ